MSVLDPITLSGGPGSPYTRKMLAVLRYRRIPYRFIFGAHRTRGLPQPKVRLMPTFYFPDSAGELQAVTDSTPIIRRLEGMTGDRSIRPFDRALALIDSILEDYGDEWLTKAMFHFRWHYDADVRRASIVLAAWQQVWPDDHRLGVAAEEVAARQIPRLRYVGSNQITWPVIEASYTRFLDTLEAHLRAHPFLLGERPGACDFGLFGQLTQLATFDPTPMSMTLERAPRVYAWTLATEDLSGLEPKDTDWIDPSNLPPTLTALLAEVGRVYAPLLIANAKAVGTGAEEVTVEVDGRPWVQKPFSYQAKCLMWLRKEYAALDPANRGVADAALEGTGLEVLFRGL